MQSNFMASKMSRLWLGSASRSRSSNGMLMFPCVGFWESLSRRMCFRPKAHFRSREGHYVHVVAQQRAVEQNVVVPVP